jgi:hypothetical protein
MPSITLRAKLPESNLDREYAILVHNAMFNLITVQLFYGKWGAKGGTRRQYSFDSPEEAKKFIKKKLSKRYSSFKRIGCSYKINDTSGAKDKLAYWFDLPWTP